MPDHSLRDALAASLPPDLSTADLVTAGMARAAHRSRGRHLAIVGASAALALGAVAVVALGGLPVGSAPRHVVPAAFDGPAAAAQGSAADKVAAAIQTALPSSSVVVGGRPNDENVRYEIWLRVSTSRHTSSLVLTVREGFSAADKAVDSSSFNCDGQVGQQQMTEFIPSVPVTGHTPVEQLQGTRLRPICTTSTTGGWTFFQVDSYDIEKGTTSPGHFAESGSSADNLFIAASSPDMDAKTLVGVLGNAGVQQAAGAYLATLR